MPDRRGRGPRGRVIPSTLVFLSQASEFSTWLENPRTYVRDFCQGNDAQFLWVRAHAFAGKSALLAWLVMAPRLDLPRRGGGAKFASARLAVFREVATHLSHVRHIQFSLRSGRSRPRTASGSRCDAGRRPSRRSTNPWPP